MSRRYFASQVRPFLFLLIASLSLVLAPARAQEILKSNFESSMVDYNPWAGATATGLLRVITGSQPAVTDSGRLSNVDFGPSVAVGDLNGDGLQDLVIADSYGFFWYFPNSGTAFVPKFTHGEVMPIWLGFDRGDPNYLGDGGVVNVVPKVQMLPLDPGSKRLDLVAGNYVGRLFYLRNQGSGSNPSFKMPGDRASLIVPTRRAGMLWCNFLSPFLYDWYGTGNLDLILGEGTYSANSIYLLQNKGTLAGPTFTEEFTTKIIPGMGAEHLTPQVVDWNNDGKPDIIAGDRTGHITLFTNTSADVKTPTFDAGTPISLGSRSTFGALTTVTVCDLTGNKLPNLIVTDAAGDILYAPNTGKRGSPQFGNPVPMTGVNPFPKINRPIGWHLYSPHGVPHELLVCTNATVEPGFTPPQNTTFKNALRYWVYPVTNTYFKEFYYPKDESFENSNFHVMACDSGFVMKEGTNYKITGWIRGDGVRELKTWLQSEMVYPDGTREGVVMSGPLDPSSAWNQFNVSAHYNLKMAPKHNNVIGFILQFRWLGQGNIYLDDVRITAVP